MSSRVQKGGQKFKPVAKPRGRQSEGIQSRKPPSGRGSTQETFRTQSSAPYESHSHNNDLQAAPSTAGQTLLGQTEGPSHTPSQKPLSTSRDTRSNKPTSSRSAGGANRDAEIASTSQDRNGTPAIAISIPTRASDIENSVLSRPATIITPSRSQSTHISKISIPAIQKAITPVSQAASQPEPTLHPPLHESLPSNSPNDVSQSTLVGTLPNETPEMESTATVRHGESSTALSNAEVNQDAGPSQAQRKTRRRAKKSVVESDVEGSETTDRAGIEKRMTRKRGIPARAKKTSETENSDARGDSGENPPQRRKRMRHSTTQQSTTDGQSDIATSGAEGSESDTQGRDKKRRRSVKSSLSTSTGRRRSRNPTTPILFDPDAGPGEELDPTVITMATLCGDTGQGRISSKGVSIQRNHLAWKAANKEKRERMRAAMEAKKYGRKEDEDRAKNESSEAAEESTVTENAEENTSQVAESSGTPAVEDASGSGFNYRESLAVNRFSAQIRIGPNGETIIDEESLFVDRAEGTDEGADNYQHVEESDQTKFTNSATYSRKARGSRWSAEETELFFDALSQFGENYELISYVLPGRDRKSCKNKFKAEDKKNSNRITYCLNNRIPYDMQTLSRLTGKDFSGPTPEIIAPEMPTFVDEPREAPSEAPSESEKSGRKPHKKSKTPATSDVEVMGDVETFEMGDSDG